MLWITENNHVVALPDMALDLASDDTHVRTSRIMERQAQTLQILAALRRNPMRPYHNNRIVLGFLFNLNSHLALVVTDLPHPLSLHTLHHLPVVDERPIRVDGALTLSFGGKVTGNAVRCPYHAWEFDRTGTCTRIAYAKKIPKNARVKHYTVVEEHGMIFMYRDKAGTTPEPKLPPIYDFDYSEYLEPKTFEFEIRIHGQDIMENSVDSAHFWAVHGHEMPKNAFFSERGELRVNQTTSVHRFGYEMHAQIEFHMREPGFHYVHFPKLPGGAKAFVFSSIVPVDEEFTNHRLTVMVRRSRIPGFSQVLQRFITWQMVETYKEDTQIWESKAYRKTPVLCDGDGPIMRYRQWYETFYPEKKHSLEVVRA